MSSSYHSNTYNNEVDSPTNDPSSPHFTNAHTSTNSSSIMRSSLSSNSSDVLSLVFTPQWHQSDFKGNILPSRVSLWLSNPSAGASSTSGVLQAGAPISLEFYAFCSPTTNQSKKFVKMADVSMFDASRDQMNDNCVSRCEPSHWIDTVNVSPLQRVETQTPATGATTQMNFLLYRSKSEGRTNQLAYVKLYPGNKYKLEIRIARSSSDDDSKVERFDGPSETPVRGFDVPTLAARGFTWHMGHARMVRSGNGSTESQGNIDESLITIDSVYLNGKSWDKYNNGHASSLSSFDVTDCRTASREVSSFGGSMMPAPLEIPVMTGAPMLPAPVNAGTWNFHTPFTQPTYTDGTKEEKKNTFDLPSPAMNGSGARGSFLTLPSSSPSWPATGTGSGDSLVTPPAATMETRRNKRKAVTAPVVEVVAESNQTTTAGAAGSDVDAPFAFKKNKLNTEFMVTPIASLDDCPVTPTTPSGHSISSTSTTGEVERVTYGLEEFVFATIQQQAQEELEAMRRHQQREEAELLARLRQRHQAQEQELHNRQRRSLIQTMLREMGRVDPSLAGMSVAPSHMAQVMGARAFAPVSVDHLLQPDACHVPPSPSSAPLAMAGAAPRAVPPPPQRRMPKASAATTNNTKQIATITPPAPTVNAPVLMSTRAATRAHANVTPQGSMMAPNVPVAAARPGPISLPLPLSTSSSSSMPSPSCRVSPMDNTIDGVPTTPGALTRLLSVSDVNEWNNVTSSATTASGGAAPLFFDGLPQLADDTLVFV